MAKLDKKTADEAFKAFIDHNAELDEWDSDEFSPDSQMPAEQLPPTGVKEEPPDGPAPRLDKPKPSILSGDDTKVSLINRKLTRSQAKELTLPEYDAFDDVVENGEVNLARLAEYTSTIPFYYHAVRSSKEKMGFLPKYPLFLALFDVKKCSDISVSAVLAHFAPGDYENAMRAEREADAVARSGAELIAKYGLDMNRKLDDGDFEVMRRNGVKDTSRFSTLGDVCGFNPDMFECDSGCTVMYNSDYEREMRGVDYC